MCLLGESEPGLHQLFSAFPPSWGRPGADPGVGAQGGAPSCGREETARWGPGRCASLPEAIRAGRALPPRLQHGVGVQLSALPGALLLPALLTFPAALRGHQAAEELRDQHGRGAAARAPLAAPGALGLLPRAGGVTDKARELAGGYRAARAPGWVSSLDFLSAWPRRLQYQVQL